MIESRKELKFYIEADRIMNGCSRRRSPNSLINRILLGGRVIDYLKAMRCYSYYKRQKGVFSKLLKRYWGFRFYRLGLKLSFSIGEDVFGYGLVIPHYGTIVVGGSNSIGNYAVLHTSTCISAKGCIIGDGMYLSTGVKITKGVGLGNGVMIGANSVVNSSFGNNVLIVGSPAKEKASRQTWYFEEPVFYDRVQRIENLRKKMNICFFRQLFDIICL